MQTPQLPKIFTLKNLPMDHLELPILNYSFERLDLSKYIHELTGKTGVYIIKAEGKAVYSGISADLYKKLRALLVYRGNSYIAEGKDMDLEYTVDVYLEDDIFQANLLRAFLDTLDNPVYLLRDHDLIDSLHEDLATQAKEKARAIKLDKAVELSKTFQAHTYGELAVMVGLPVHVLKKHFKELEKKALFK